MKSEMSSQKNMIFFQFFGLITFAVKLSYSSVHSRQLYCSETRKFIKELNNYYTLGDFEDGENLLLKKSGVFLHTEIESRLSHGECYTGLSEPKCSGFYCIQADHIGDHVLIESLEPHLLIRIPKNRTECRSIWREVEIEICGTHTEKLYLPISVQKTDGQVNSNLSATSIITSTKQS